jgi:hypothetical protein
MVNRWLKVHKIEAYFQKKKWLNPVYQFRLTKFPEQNRIELIKEEWQ